MFRSSPSNRIWRSRDSALVAASFIVPLITGIFSLLTYDEISMGTVTPIELDWSVWAVIGLLVTVYASYLLIGDQMALYISQQNRLQQGGIRTWQMQREWLGGLWVVNIILGIDAVFIAFVVLGIVSLQLPSNPIARVAGVPPQFITGGSLMLAEAILETAMVFGLICRRRLAAT